MKKKHKLAILFSALAIIVVAASLVGTMASAAGSDDPNRISNILVGSAEVVETTDQVALTWSTTSATEGFVDTDPALVLKVEETADLWVKAVKSVPYDIPNVIYYIDGIDPNVVTVTWQDPADSQFKSLGGPITVGGHEYYYFGPAIGFNMDENWDNLGQVTHIKIEASGAGSVNVEVWASQVVAP